MPLCSRSGQQHSFITGKLAPMEIKALSPASSVTSDLARCRARLTQRHHVLEEPCPHCPLTPLCLNTASPHRAEQGTAEHVANTGVLPPPTSTISLMLPVTNVAKQRPPPPTVRPPAPAPDKWISAEPARKEQGVTVHLVDFRVGGQDLISQLLGSGQHLSVVCCDQILNKLLELVPVHLEKGL